MKYLHTGLEKAAELRRKEEVEHVLLLQTPWTPFFCGRRPLPFGGSHLKLPSRPAGIRTTIGSLSALARPTPYQLSHRVAFQTPWTPEARF